MTGQDRIGRRRALLAIGSAVSLAGCASAPGPTATEADGPTDSRTRAPETPSPTRTPAPPPSEALAFGEQFVSERGWTVAMAEPAARRMVVDWALTDPPVTAPEDVGFLLATASTTADAHAGVAAGGRKLGKSTPTHTPHSPEPGEGEPEARHLRLAVEVDGERNPAGRPFWAGRTVSGADVRRWAFPVPADPDPESVAVVWHRRREATVTWAVPGDVVDALGRLPSFAVRRFEATRANDGDDPGAELTVEVANTGERDGRFLAFLGIDRDGYPELLELSVPRDGSTTASRRLPREPGESTTYVLEWAGRTLRRTVRPEGV